MDICNISFITSSSEILPSDFSFPKNCISRSRPITTDAFIERSVTTIIITYFASFRFNDYRYLITYRVLEKSSYHLLCLQVHNLLFYEILLLSVALSCRRPVGTFALPTSTALSISEKFRIFH
ncbi:hypothetical protein PUN28_020699 [Cardiocondyla obscurior]|uniref:Uncharacterized protein n=1 Tax=Cardiocondyla obscurior TaxID=286306 RepID=A0AAW2E4Z9_9HYME